MYGNILGVDFIETSKMAGAYALKHHGHLGDVTVRQSAPGSPYRETEAIILRGPFGHPTPENWQDDIPHGDYEILEEWPTARRVIDDIAESHRLRASGREPQFGKIIVESMRPGGHIAWHADETPYAKCYDRFRLCLIPSPAAWLYSGGDSQILPVGQLTWINHLVLHSAINGGRFPCVTLVVDIRKPQSN